MMDIVKAKTDIVFKMLFTDKDNHDVLQGFVSDILDIPYDDITDIVIENSEITPDEIDGKFTRFDLKITAAGRLINVEIQVVNLGDFRERSLYYWSQRYGRQLKKGQRYDEIMPTISINIVNFNMFKTDSYYSEFTMADLEHGEILTDKCKLFYFELPKLDKNYDENDKKKAWMQLINSESEGDLDMLAERTHEPAIHRGVTILKTYSADEKVRMMAEKREETLREELSALNFATQQGRREGEDAALNAMRELGIDKAVLDAVKERLKNR